MAQGGSPPPITDASVRLDKWLWAARFFKTRQLAHAAIDAGRVLLAGERVKSSRMVCMGDVLTIRIDRLDYQVKVVGLATLRVSAKNIGQLYVEGDASRVAREQQSALLQAEWASQPRSQGRPTKRARRDLMKFKSTS